MLAEIYGWFTEGFDTADLKDAKALLGGVEPIIGRQRKYALFEMRRGNAHGLSLSGTGT